MQAEEESAKIIIELSNVQLLNIHSAAVSTFSYCCCDMKGRIIGRDGRNIKTLLPLE